MLYYFMSDKRIYILMTLKKNFFLRTKFLLDYFITYVCRFGERK